MTQYVPKGEYTEGCCATCTGRLNRQRAAAMKPSKALAAPPEPLREAHPGENHEFRTTCQKCGERGTLVISLITDDEQVRTEPRAALSEPHDKPVPR